MPLADVLQWLDTYQKRAFVTVQRPDGSSGWLLVEGRFVTATVRPPVRGMLAADGDPSAPGPGLVAVAADQLLDLFLSDEGTFELDEDAEPPEGGVAMRFAIQFLVMEGLRLLDEWPRIQETYPDDAARLGATDMSIGELDPVSTKIRELALEAPPLAEARLVLGLSRTGFLRRVDELRQRGLVDVEGIPHGTNIESSVVDQAQILLRERQFAEATHVFHTLLASNPDDARVRHLLAEAERLQLAAFHERYSPTHVVSAVGDPSGYHLQPTDRAILEQLTRPRSVAVLVLVSPLRELETLLALERLAGKGLVAVESAD